MEELPRGQWGVDPYDRHELRWWDGSAWTEHVLDGTDAGVDPLGPLRPGRVDRRMVLHVVLVVLTLGLSFMAWRAVQSVRGGRTKEARAWTVGGLVWLVLLVSLSDGIGGRPADVNGHIATPEVRTTAPGRRPVPDGDRAPAGTAAAWRAGSPSAAAGQGASGQNAAGQDAAGQDASGQDAPGAPGAGTGSDAGSGPDRTAQPVTTTAPGGTPGPAPGTTPTRGSSPGPTTSTTEHADPTTAPATASTTASTTRPAGKAVDRRYGSCRAVIAHGLGPYYRGEPEYEWYPDRNRDGVVCDSARGRHRSWW